MNYTEIDPNDDILLDIHSKLLMLRNIDLPTTYDPDNLPEDLHQAAATMKELKAMYVETVNRLIRVNKEHDEKRKKIDRMAEILNLMEGDAVRYKDSLQAVLDQFSEDERLVELKQEYEETVERFRALRHVINFVASDDMNRYMCFTCLDRSIDSVLVPCGHVGCSLCTSRFTTACPYCRSEVSQVVKLYLG
jgi:hypothetical protein